jgi:hypothetical protein
MLVCGASRCLDAPNMHEASCHDSGSHARSYPDTHVLAQNDGTRTEDGDSRRSVRAIWARHRPAGGPCWHKVNTQRS